MATDSSRSGFLQHTRARKIWDQCGKTRDWEYLVGV